MPKKQKNNNKTVFYPKFRVPTPKKFEKNLKIFDLVKNAKKCRNVCIKWVFSVQKARKSRVFIQSTPKKFPKKYCILGGVVV